MSTTPEVRRIAEVYRRYHESGAPQERWSEANPGNCAIRRERIRVLGDLLGTAGFLPLTDRRILEVGCGSGKVLASLTRWGAVPRNLFGVDLLPDRVEEARRTFAEIHFAQGNAERLELPDASFDLVMLFTVFSSILDEEMARNVAGEVRRVLKPGGAVVWYDFRYNNPRNASVRGMSRHAIRGYFPGYGFQLRTVTVLPPLVRRLGRSAGALYPALALPSLLRTHHLALLIKP